MAGSKETPRQKMIGLMYLVLVAMLAIQVSSAIIYKFQFLNSSLESFLKDSETRNKQKLGSMMDQIAQRGNRPEEVRLKEMASAVTKKSDTLLRYIDELKLQLVSKTGGYEDNGNLKGAQEETAVEVIMLGASPGEGKAYELKKRLDEYIRFMNTTGTVSVSPMALDGKQQDIFKNNPEQRSKDFAELNFGQTPLVAGLATLSEIAARVSSVKTASLAYLSDKIGDTDLPVDHLEPMVRPGSKVVVAGTKYEAELFMAATSSSQKPKMAAEGRVLEVDGRGIGKFAFTAGSSNFGPDGFAKKTWKGNITFKLQDGRDTTYSITEEYLVAKPTIKVQAGIMKKLYRNCGNVLDVQVPMLGADYNPVITVTGAAIEKGAKKGLITVIPTAPQASIKVQSNGVYIGEETYGVRLIPTPRLEGRIRNKSINPVLGVAKSELLFFSLKVIPDKEFAESLPMDARYYLPTWKATLARRSSNKGMEEFKGENPNFRSLAAKAEPGDRIVIEVTRIMRKNFKDQTEEVKVNEVVIIPII